MRADAGLVPIALATLRQAGWQATRLQAGTARGGRMHLADAGWYDIIALSPIGIVYFIEAKAEKGSLSESQRRFAAWCRAHGHGHRLVVIWSVDDVVQLVQGRRR